MIEIKSEYKALCAKTDRKRTDIWLPLWMHLIDTAEVIGYLCCHWLSVSAKHAIGLDDEELMRYCRFLGMVHDIGKGTTLFQYQITQKNMALREKLSDGGWDIKIGNLDTGKTKHALAGEAILRSLGAPESVSIIVGSHHGIPSDSKRAVQLNFEAHQWNYHLKADGSDKWTNFWKEWMKISLEYVGYFDISELPNVHMRAQMLLSGLLIMADWIASNTYYFPLIGIEEEQSLCVYPLRTEKALARLDFPEKSEWTETVSTVDDFFDRFGFQPNNIQKEVMDTVSNSKMPGIVILEAQMGSGKTEAALAATEICARKIGADGFFFGLPTQATADNIFSRISLWGEKLSEISRHTIRLVHGMAEFNEDYISLQDGTVNIDDEMMDNYDEAGNDSGLIVHEWFTGRKKALLSDYVIGTVDQLLMAGLKQKHVMLRHLGLAGKVAVVDECHAYDTYMSRYLQRALRWLGSYNIPVILLSATLPAARREELVKAYTGQKKLEGSFEPGNRAYPLLTWSDSGKIYQRSIHGNNQRNLQVEIRWLNDCDIIGILKDMLADGGCAGIIVNTVKRAQEIYRDLSSSMKEIKIILCHAQMLATDRSEIQKKISILTGKKSDKTDRSRVVVIGTSVLEQSLDIDFDVLFSDLCPMDLLLQRMGRLHRHSFHDSMRGSRMEKPICFVLCGMDSSLDNDACHIYGKYLLFRTKFLLPPKVYIPDSIPDLVQDTYDDTNDFGLSGKEYADAKEAYLLRIGKKGQKAGVYRIAEPDMKDEFSCRKSILGLLTEQIADRDSRAEAAVRDAGNSIDVLLLMKDVDGDIRFLPWQNGGISVPTHCVPSKEECKEIMKQRIRLPFRFCHEGIIDQTIRELEKVYREEFFEWRESVWLGRELILLLDKDLSAELDGIPIQYKLKEGLICGKEGNEKK